MKNKLIIIEGTDCSGKQTQSELLKKKLEERGYTIFQTGFPMYDTPTGKIVGDYYLGKNGGGLFPEGATNVNQKVAGLYYAADRLYNLEKIENNLKKGSVILDRYVDSNLAHQGAKILDKEKREETYKFFETLEYDLLGLPQADVKVLIYMPNEYAKILKKNREELDQHEKDEEYLKNAETCYLEIAERGNFKKIDCISNGEIRSIEDINNELLEFVISRLEEE